MMDGLKRVLLGVERDPQVVALARAFVLYVLPLGTEALCAWLLHLHDARWLGVAAVTVPLIRAIEGSVDQQLKASQNAAFPAPPAGETPPPAVPLAPHGGKRGH